MSTANVFVKVGTTMARVKPENVESIRLQLERASKIRSPAQHRAVQARVGIGREYPKFVEGTSVQKYVEDYLVLNSKNFTYGALHAKREAAKTAIKDFFQPLSTLPMFTPDDTVVEEAMT